MIIYIGYTMGGFMLGELNITRKMEGFIIDHGESTIFLMKSTFGWGICVGK